MTLEEAWNNNRRLHLSAETLFQKSDTLKVLGRLAAASYCKKIGRVILSLEDCQCSDDIVAVGEANRIETTAIAINARAMLLVLKANIMWAKAVRALEGNIKMTWGTNGGYPTCTLESGEKFATKGD